jgi:glycosyltransferase involved in cell wall biosynthesis
MSDPVWEEKRLAIEHASSYACISKNTRRDLFELEAAAGGKPAHVVPLGVGDHFTVPSQADVAAFRARHKLTRPYFLVVGERHGVEGYKNVKLAFRALHGWAGADAHELLCVGGARRVEADLKAIGPGVRARRLALSDEDLRLCYAGAVALIFPSRYEGFGLPVAEAMACGCPVITTAVASLPEVAGDAAVYIDPEDPRSLQEAFDIVRDPHRRETLVAAGIERAAGLTWARAASAFASALTEAAAADTPDQRQVRAGVWRARRNSQDHAQGLTSGRATEFELRGRPALIERDAPGLRGLALCHLSPSAISVLRSVHGSARHRLNRLRQSFAPR